MSGGHGTIDPRYVERMNALAEVIDEFLNEDLPTPRNIGFMLLVFEFGNPNVGIRQELPARMNYISNAQRADMLTAMRELLKNFEDDKGQQ